MQLIKWNPWYNLHRLIILIIIIYFIIRKKHDLFTYSLFFCCIAQHFVLLITHPDSRYAYLAWLLTFLLFVKIVYEYNIINNLYNRIFKRT